MRIEECYTLLDAYNKAILINKRLERDRARQRDTKANLTRTNSSTAVEKETPQVSVMQPDRQQSASTKPSTETKICAYCKNFGHLISECRKRQYNNNVSENKQGNSPGPSTTGASQGQANVRPLYPIITEVLESPSSNSTQESCLVSK
ncbi:hypothetical protein ALC62_01202 [Cyphomyrmex costatus]|uniref:CCHC-type domain-containing protein n=1 Tax=Cyphomyrmex costatus TaxID=456900 RepID=A0A151IPC8_9HYME|nr:hypothetical protein ALC62_01202 [Cyphomyrmex costatus]